MELEFAKLDAADRDSARKREVEMAKADVHFITKNITSILAIGILTGSIVIAMLVFFVDFPDSQENILIFVLGSLFSIATQVVSYYFGSSQGSKDKTAELKEAMKK
jgi:O-antigen/teichoic acid export membrane protein